jgi:hypothetical protein
VKNLTNASFATALSLALDATNPGRKRSQWLIGALNGDVIA